MGVGGIIGCKESFFLWWNGVRGCLWDGQSERMQQGVNRELAEMRFRMFISGDGMKGSGASSSWTVCRHGQTSFSAGGTAYGRTSDQVWCTGHTCHQAQSISCTSRKWRMALSMPCLIQASNRAENVEPLQLARQHADEPRMHTLTRGITSLMRYDHCS